MMMTWALSLVAIIAMSDRTLLTSHARCWIVGSLPYLRRLDMVERTQACVIYSRGEIPSWARNYSPLGDLPFLRHMTELEQIAFANEFPSPGLAAFIAASTDEALQERERAEVWSIRTGPVCKAGDHARADLSTAP